ncbi:liver-enriched gene 1, tandem duplicate 1 [Scleropages formosus]|uniref:Chromosome 6 open reading frame 58 n=1 Tax=Scleropages formosus TaxID=113540 RepID=A0A8C9SBQ7_SCLFO|nr:protein LEG1 homolog [Scleropages formosus]
MHLVRAVTLLLLHGLCAHSAVITEGGYPILWDKVPERISQQPPDNGMLVVQPWDYLQRMSLLKWILNATDDYMTSMGPGPNENPLWNLPLQLSWLYKSGRLADPTDGTTCGHESGDSTCISPHSWWACMNYYLSVIPFLAAVETGTLGQGLTSQVEALTGVEQDYCTSYSDCYVKHTELMEKWNTFYQGLKNLSTSELPDSEKKEQILTLMWDAEVSSLHTSSQCSDLRKHYSNPEQKFSRIWVDSTEFMAATHLQSSLDKAAPLLIPLPGRVLKEDDSPPNIADLSEAENHALYIFYWMESMNSVLEGVLKTMWRSAMCSIPAREKGQAVLRDLVLEPKFAVAGLMSIMKDMTSTCSLPMS